MNVNVRIIPHETQRYPSSGDYFWDENGDLQILVSKLGDTVEAKHMEQMIAIHEYVEAVLCQARGITDDQISGFDKAFERARRGMDTSEDRKTLGKQVSDERPTDEEPGDDPGAPYRREHCLATAVERMLCASLGLDWNVYEATCERVEDQWRKTTW